MNLECRWYLLELGRLGISYMKNFQYSMNHTKKISKIDASRRQLDTAIRLYFNHGDEISIHTLTCASHEILKKIGENTNIESVILDKMVNMAYENKREELRKKLNEAKTFFKHGLRGSKEIGKTVDFNPILTEFWLWDACLMYEQLTGENTNYMHIFLVWFYMQHEGIIQKGEYKKRVLEIKTQAKDLTPTRQEFFSVGVEAFSKIN